MLSPRLLVLNEPILFGSLILFTLINNKKERRKHMNTWIETTTIATEVNLNKDFHLENKTIENKENNKNDYLTALADKILNNEVKCYPQTY
tara:strand:- start:807 stop:1079 length:273 start_codon:yes stop_codon:yes gene_type:complete